MTSVARTSDVFATGGVVWHRRWAVAPGEHVNAGRHVWEGEVRVAAGVRSLTVWCESRRFEANRRGEKVVVATYRAAVDKRPIDGTWSTVTLAMDAASVAAVKARAA